MKLTGVGILLEYLGGVERSVDEDLLLVWTT